MEKHQFRAEWIWEKENTVPNDTVVFRKTFILDNIPKNAISYAAVDTKYWLFINGKMAVFEGGLFRESLPGCGYADCFDLAPYLQTGKNDLVCISWFYGNEGRNNTNSTHAGWIFECESLALFSGSNFLCLRHPAYYQTGEPNPSYLYGGFNANLDMNFFDLNFDDSKMHPASVYPNDVWGEQVLRPIPFHRRGSLCRFSDIPIKNGKAVLSLPKATQFLPYLEVEAKRGEVIDIHSDRYTVNGGPGDETRLYSGHRIEYICAPGLNRFDSLNYLFGEQIVYSFSESVKVLFLGYRNSGYDTDIIGLFTCDDELLNTLVQKSANTLYVCMRDNFMDCPDRERGQWIGDVSVQMPQIFYLMDSNSQKLAKKAISDFIHLRKGDVLVGNVPGADFSELPAQSLNAISEMGFIAEYYRGTGDTEVLSWAFEPAVRYLMLWNLNDDGLIVGRKGNWRWFDHLYNADEDVLENAWYYSAIKFSQEMANILDDHRFDSFLEERAESILRSFDRCYFQGDYYSSKGIVDDRANAMAVLSGLCKKENYPKIRTILLSVFNATTYMENYILTALCKMNYRKDAYHRMMSRYYNLAQNENSTLWEDFYILGTKNHAWSGAPATIAFRYFMGIETNDGYQTFRINYEKSLFKKMNCCFPAKNGTVTVNIDNEKGNVSILNQSDSRYIPY